MTKKRFVADRFTALGKADGSGFPVGAEIIEKSKVKQTDRDVLRATLKWLSGYAPLRWRADLRDATLAVPVREIHDAYRRIERHLEAKP